VSQKQERGAYTRSVIDAILNGCSTLRQIADATGISYRSVNAIVDSLERQNRVLADDYKLRRGEQQFRVLHADRVPPKQRGYSCHPRNRPTPMTISIPLHPSGLLASLFGVVPPALMQASGSSRVHRLL
jgi:hypothetical protein